MSLTFERPRAAAVAIIFEGSVLWGKRCELYDGSPVAFGGYWSVFGGIVEEGESPFWAAAREVLEETRIPIPLHELKFIKSFDAGSLDFILYAYEANSLLVPVLNCEHTEHGWFKISELERFPEKIDQKIVEGINFYIKRRTAEQEHCITKD